MLSPLKRVMVEYNALIVKMHSNHDKTKFAHENLEMLCDLELILALPCFMPMLEVIHIHIKYAQHQDAFIINFVDAMNFVEAELFHLHANPIFSFDNLVFDVFTQNCFQYSHDVLPLSWCSNLIEGHEFLILRLQDRFMLSTLAN